MNAYCMISVFNAATAFTGSISNSENALSWLSSHWYEINLYCHDYLLKSVIINTTSLWTGNLNVFYDYICWR